MRQRTYLPAFVLACLAILPVMAQNAAPAAKKGMFWKATSGGNVVYLLGSIHLGTKDMYPMAKEIEDAFERSKALLVEADIRNVDAAKAQQMIFAKGMYAGDDVLWNHVSASTKQKVEEFCAKFELPAVAFAKMKPWVLSITMAVIPIMKQGLDPNLGVDKYLLDKAGTRKVVEIESADWQIDLLSGFSDELQERMLVAAAQEAGEMKEASSRMQDAWKSGDAAKMDALIRETSHSPKEITKAMLEDRNPHMADVAEQYLKGKEPAFMVVGAAHMVGKDGVVSLLEKRGYKVEQVSLK